MLSTIVDAATSPTGSLSSAMRLFRGNTQLSPDVMNEMQRILFSTNFQPSMLKRDIIPGLFDIPRSPPVVTAGTFGGLVGSQQDSILNNLRSMGLIE